MEEENKEVKGRKQWGIALIVLPIAVWLIVAFANGFDFSHPWLGSKGNDLFLGLLGAISIVIGSFLAATGSDKSNK